MTSYSHAGVSTLKGVTKVRFANDALRVKVLAKNGHTNIDMVELKVPMSKEDAIAYLLSIDFATQNGTTNAAVQAALEEAVEKRTVAAPKAKVVKPVVAKVAKVAKVQPTIEAIKAKVATAKAAKVKAETADAALDDAPY